MCHVTTVLEAMRKKRTITNKDILALAEAQGRDTRELKEERAEMVGRMAKLESDVAVMKEDISVIKGNIQVIMEYIKSPADKERLDGQKWNLLTSIARHKSAWVILAVVLIAFALSGDRLVRIIADIIAKLIA